MFHLGDGPCLSAWLDGAVGRCRLATGRVILRHWGQLLEIEGNTAEMAGNCAWKAWFVSKVFLKKVQLCRKEAFCGAKKHLRHARKCVQQERKTSPFRGDTYLFVGGP